MRDVFGCYLTDGFSVAHSFMRSVMRLVQTDERLLDGGLQILRTGSGEIANNRNALMVAWLDSTDAEWCWMIDSDMGFEPDTLDLLLAAADPEKRPVVGALCFSQRMDMPDTSGGYTYRIAPTIFNWDGYGFRGFLEYPPDTLMTVDGTGAACLLIHRSIAERMRAIYGPAWFDPILMEPGRTMGEDLSFCRRLHLIHQSVCIVTGVKTTHMKPRWMGETEWSSANA